jgi:hypothetical protein
VSSEHVGGRTREPRHTGATPIGADHGPGPDVTDIPRLVAQTNPGNPSVVGMKQIQHLYTVVNVGAGLTRGVDQDPVEYAAPWRVERIHAVPSLDVDLGRFTSFVVGVDEGGLGNSRRPLCFEAVGQAPALEQKHRRPH